MIRTRLFQSNRFQAVRLAREVAFPPEVQEVTVIREGVRRVILPADAAWDDFFAAPGISLPERAPPEHQAREGF